MTRAQPEWVRGTSGTIAAIPTVLSPKPASTMLLGRRFPDLRPASSATPNMLSDSGASDKPACIALYSRIALFTMRILVGSRSS